MTKKMQQLKKKKGFTLIEIIVVLVILAILVAVALPTMFGYVEEARAKSLVQDARVGLLGAQWIVSEFVLIRESATLTREALTTTVLGYLNATNLGTGDQAYVRNSFTQKVDGVSFPHLGTSGTTGFSGFTSVASAGLTNTPGKVTGVTYNSTTYSITIADGVTTTIKNTTALSAPGTP